MFGNMFNATPRRGAPNGMVCFSSLSEAVDAMKASMYMGVPEFERSAPSAKLRGIASRCARRVAKGGTKLFRHPENMCTKQTRTSAAAYSTVVDVPQAELAEPTPT